MTTLAPPIGPLCQENIESNGDAAATPRSGKVLMIVEDMPVPLDRRSWMIASSLQRAGYEVSVICPAGQGHDALREEIEGVRFYRYPVAPEDSSATGYMREYASALWWQWRLARRVRRERGFDVIHACNPPDLTFLVALWFKLLHGTRFLFDHHDLCPELYESKFNRRGFFYRMLRWVERATFRVANTVISTNQSYKQIAIERGKRRPEDVFVVRSGPNLSLFQRCPADDTFRRGRRHLVGYIGLMGESDGVDHLVRAAHELVVKRGRDDIQFCLIGSGIMFEALQALAAELGVQDHVEFTGRISDQEVCQRLSSCDVCVNPDPMNPLNDKSTMNKILEYMAMERPIVQYDLCEGRRSAQEASVYAEPNNIQDLATQIERLLADPERRRHMGAIGRQRMEQKLEWRHQIPKLLAAYDHVLHRNGAAATCPSE